MESQLNYSIIQKYTQKKILIIYCKCPATGLHVPEPVVSDERINTAVGEGLIHFHLN